MQSCTVTCVHADTSVDAGTYPPGSGYGYGPAVPTLASVAPTTAANGAGNQTITLTGTGFLHGMYVTLSKTGSATRYYTPTIVSPTSATIVIPLNIGIGAWSIRVENIAGVSPTPRTFTIT